MKNIPNENYQKSFKTTKKLYGGGNAREIKKLEKIANKVEEKEGFYEKMSDEELRGQTAILKDRLAKGATLDEILPDAYAVCREAAKRVLHQRHYYVQLLGGIALHQGRICQMSTGEGKTLTETLPAYLNALAGNGVHIVTVNEYLATRDMEWMGKVFNFLGVTVGVTLADMTLSEKQHAYSCDITYGTNNEFGFDYLRDNMAKNRHTRVQRELNYVLVDEVDSVLIDEARTPLIISGRSGEAVDSYVQADRFVRTLQKSTNVDEEGKPLVEGQEPNGHYVVDRKEKHVRLTDSGINKAERFFRIDNLSGPEGFDLVHYINNALHAHALMNKDEDYIVENGQVIIVDSFTGRKMEGRRFSNGLHQAIEAKEKVRIKEEDKTLATITFQNYFRLYRKMSGMTGTAQTEEREFNDIYNLDVVVIPTNMPLIREDCSDQVYKTRKGKLNAIVQQIKQCHATGQPVLVGTVTVEKSEELSQLLKAEGISNHEVLNAKFHKREAEIIAQAGRIGAITIATNMAGRGTDILLGGNPEFLAKREMKKYHDDEEIERSTSFVHGDEETEKLHQEYMELLKKYQAETEAERQKVLELGGLQVIGTERHESRRIDNQLRGRSGRQGDPGCSVFYVSLEDDMIKIFGKDRLDGMMSLLTFPEDVPIESKMLNKVIEIAQKRIEGMNFSSRKYVLQYDDVNNRQRKIIYGERNKVLNGDDIHPLILNMCEEYARSALENACDRQMDVCDWDIRRVNSILAQYIPSDEDLFSEEEVREARTAKKVWEILTQTCKDLLDDKLEEYGEDFIVAERTILLVIIDRLWINHIDALDDLKKGIGLQAIGQHDPLEEYKKEAFKMFEELNSLIEFNTIHNLLFGDPQKIARDSKLDETEEETEIPDGDYKLNDFCPCGSGKKYKHCCYLKKQQQTAEAAAENRPLTKQEEYALKRQQRKKDKNKK